MANPSDIVGSRILIVDDHQVNVQVLQSMLQRSGYLNITTTTDPTAVFGLHREKVFDLILLDIQMPVMDGFQIIDGLKQIETANYPSILVITAQPDHKLRAMQAGAKDFISKPFDHAEVLTRIHYMLEVRLLSEETRNYSKRLEETVQERTVELRRSEEMFRELVENIPEALWIKDLEHQTIEYVNPAWNSLNGVRATPGDPLKKGHQTIHPDDLKWVTHERRKSLCKRTSNEYRLLRPDQSVRWVHTKSFPITSQSGKSPWVVEIIEDVTQRREAQLQLVHLARHDTLTNLPNRAHVYESLREALAYASIQGSSVSFMLLDVDFFKNVNDTRGHTAGDALLREFAARVATCSRPEDLLGRLGGDEFALIVATPADTFGAQFIAARIRKALKTPLVVDGQEIPVTASIGIASYPFDATDLEGLIRCADIAMYEAKASGRNASRTFTPQMNARALEKAEIGEELQLALARREFVLHYQPKIQIETGRTSSVEALIRWNRPQHGLALPGDFVPALEEMGLIIPVGAWVIETACQQIHAWETAGLGPVRIAVNASSRQVREERFVAQVADALQANHVNPSLLEIEITEGTFMEHDAITDAALRSLKDMGVSISIDDFGTGYSNLAYLKRFQVDALKIDITFVRDVATDADAATIVVAIINMAHDLRLKVVAEGVETAEQLKFLHFHGCDEAQGFLFSHPLAVDELTGKLWQAAAREAEQKLIAPERGRRTAHA